MNIRRNTRIVTHPDNEKLLTKECDFLKGLIVSKLDQWEVVFDSHLEKDKASGKYVMPDGRVVTREEVVVKEGRYFEWGPEDLRWLLKCGIVKEHREPVFYVMSHETRNDWAVTFMNRELFEQVTQPRGIFRTHWGI